MGLAHLFFSSLWRKMIIVLAAVALSLAKKAANLYLSMLGTRLNPIS